jgi:hypothetical protein
MIKQGLKLIGTHHLLVYADDASLLGENVHIIRTDMKAVRDVSMEVGPEVNTEKTM